MQTRRSFIAGAGASIFALALSSCSTGANGSAQQNDLPTITVGSDNYPPYNYLDENGNPTGIDVEIATEAFRRIGLQTVFSYIRWDSKNELLSTGEIDCLAGCFSMTGREDDYRWAGPYMSSQQVVAVNPSSEIYSLADLEGKSVAVQSTSKPESILLNGTNPHAGEPRAVFCMENRDHIYPALSKGYVDAVATHKTSILQYEKDYNVEYRILDESLLDVGIGMAFDKNDARGYDEALDQALSDMHADGTLEQIISKYLDDAASYLGVDAKDA